MTPGSTVMVTRDASATRRTSRCGWRSSASSKSPLEEGDRPKVGVGAKGEGDGVHGSDTEPDADDSAS